MVLGINFLYDGVFNSLKTFLAIRCTHLNTQSKSDKFCPGNVWGLSLNSSVTQCSLTSPVQNEGVEPQTSLKHGIYTPQRSSLIPQPESKLEFCGLWLVENFGVERTYIPKTHIVSQTSWLEGSQGATIHSRQGPLVLFLAKIVIGNLQSRRLDPV